jgi:hypothetical protein
MSVEYNGLQNLESAVHAYKKLRRSAYVFIAYNSGLSECSWMSTYLSWKHEHFSKRLVPYGTKRKLTSSCCTDMYVTRVLQFRVLWLFYAPQFSSWSQSCKICVAGHASVTCTARVKPCALEWPIPWHNRADRRTWLKHVRLRTMKRYKRHDKAESCMYSDFYISVTTKMNPVRHTKNKTDYWQYKLSDS